jgi:hypothetical protein
MKKNEINTREEQLRDMGGSGGHGGANAKSNENDSRDYGKWALVATAIVLAAVAVVLWIF